jgi:5-methylcytosine-specific restriction endonuclease McrA
MSKKHTIEFIRGQFEKEGYTFSSEEYVNSKTLLKYVCPEGHNGTITWNGWQQGCRCAECGGSKKLTIEFIREQFEKEGYTLVSDVYVNSKTPLKYVCLNKHEGEIMWCNWKQGKRCKKCSGIEKLTVQFVRKQFEKEGYTLITKVYINNKQKLEYICPKNHECSTQWDRWIQGHRCSKCWYESNKGKNHPRWDLSLTNKDRQKRCLIIDYIKWARAVKERDNFTCQVCGNNKGGNLVSHHLESYNNSPDLRIVLDNGVCLCEKCHKNFHHQYGYGNNTREQFEEFMKAGV